MTDTEVIVCRASVWYFRRVAMLMALTGVMGLLFLYDGLIGYPKKNHIADLHGVFVNFASGDRIDSHPGTRSEKRERELDEARKAAREGASWAGFAASRMLAEEVPKRFTPEEIKEQFFFASLMAVVTAGLGIFWILRRNRVFQGGESSLVFPNGKRVRFDEILEINLRKWDRGIAILRYMGSDGEARVAKVDDYKYSGTGAILKRAMVKNPEIALEGDPRWLEVSAIPEARGGK
jgi:hypothetical protein